MANVDFCSFPRAKTEVKPFDWTLGFGKTWTVAHNHSAPFEPIDLDGHTVSQVNRVLAAAAQPDAAVFDNPKDALDWLNMP